MRLFTNRVDAFLSGCPDPGGVLFLPVESTPRPPSEPPVPIVTHLALPALGVSLIELAKRLGLSIFVLVHALKALEASRPVKVRLDFETAQRLCGHFGVQVTVQA